MKMTQRFPHGTVVSLLIMYRKDSSNQYIYTGVKARYKQITTT